MSGRATSVQDDPEREAARKVARAEFQLLLQRKKVEGLQEFEEHAYATYEAARTDRNLAAWRFVENRLRCAEADEELARLQVEAVSS